MRRRNHHIKHSTPILDGLMTAGVITIVDREYIGTAADGVTVSLGVAFDPADAILVERYLQDHPTPETW